MPPRKSRILASHWRMLFAHQLGGIFIAIARSRARREPGMRGSRDIHPDMPQRSTVVRLGNVADGVARADLFRNAGTDSHQLVDVIGKESLTSADVGKMSEDSRRLVLVLRVVNANGVDCGGTAVELFHCRTAS